MRWIRKLAGPEAILIAAFVLLSSGLYMGASHFGGVIESNGTVVQVAGRMRLEINSLYRWLAEAENPDPERRAAAIAEVNEVAVQIDSLLQSLIAGGSVQIGPGQPLVVEPGMVPDEATPILPQIAGVWSPVKARIDALVDLHGPERDQRLSQAIAEARAVEGALLGQASRLLGVVSVNSFTNAGYLQRVQVTGAVLGVGFFLLLIALYSRQLRRFRDAKRETDEILETVTSGLFLLDRDYRLGDQYSAQLEYILQRDQLGGTDFIGMLGDMVRAETLKTARDYLDLLFSERVEESLIGSLNPLDRVKVKLPTETGRVEARYLEFSFRRVFDEDRLLHLLVSVNDVTDRVRLGEELESLKEKQDQQTERMLELLVSLFKLDQAMLDDTLARWHLLMQQANAALKESNNRKSGLHQLIDEVFRPMHTVKSEASGLGLAFLSQRAAAVEQAIAELRGIENLSGNDFLTATVRLEELFAQFSVVRRIIERLQAQGVTQVDGQQSGHAGPVPLINLLQRLVNQLNDDLNIRAELRVRGLDEERLGGELREPVRDVLVQFIRNACAHGIEPVEQRQQLGKPPAATLDIQLRQQPSSKEWELLFRDDGRGIDFTAIARRAREMGLLADDLEPDRSRLLKLMFHPGLSTAAEVGQEAGQGVGMDIVREAVARMDANIRVATEAGKHTTFKLVIPASPSR